MIRQFVYKKSLSIYIHIPSIHAASNWRLRCTKKTRCSNAGSRWIKEYETIAQIQSVAWQLKMISLNDPEKIDDSQLKIENKKRDV